MKINRSSIKCQPERNNTLSNSKGTNKNEQQNKTIKTKYVRAIKWKKRRHILLLLKFWIQTKKIE